MKTPREIARMVLSRPNVDSYAVVQKEFTQAFGLAIAEVAINADRAQRGYEVTISYPHHGGTDQVYVQPLPGESIVQAVIREGNAAHEWVIDDVVEVL